MDESLRRLFLIEIMMWSERVTQIEIAFKFLKTKAISYRHSKGIQMEGINPLSLSVSVSPNPTGTLITSYTYLIWPAAVIIRWRCVVITVGGRADVVATSLDEGDVWIISDTIRSCGCCCCCCCSSPSSNFIADLSWSSNCDNPKRKENIYFN